jgi:hypothetical protein
VLFVGQTKYNRRSVEAQLFQRLTIYFIDFFSLTGALLLRVLQEARKDKKSIAANLMMDENAMTTAPNIIDLRTPQRSMITPAPIATKM